MRKITYLLTAFLLMSLLACTSRKQDQNHAADGRFRGTIKVGHLVALDMGPLFLAKEAGFFKEEGLDVETIFFANPGDNNTALAGGSIQISTNPFTLPYFGVNSGIKMKIISGAGGLGVMEVIIQGDYNVHSVDELVAWIKSHPKQKIRIAVLKGDTLEMIVQKMLADHGLTYADVEMVWFNDLLAMVQAFQTKQVDILSHIKPYTTDMIVNHGAQSLTTNSEVWGEGTPNCTVSVMEDFLTRYPETCLAYLRALKKGLTFLVEQPDSAASLLSRGNYYKVNKDVLLYAIRNHPKNVALRPNEAGMAMAINAMVKEGYIKQPQTSIIDVRFLDKVEPLDGDRSSITAAQ